MTANFLNRTLFHGDNLDFLKGINSGTVDLIATDPPFNKGRDFHATPESLASGAQFQDRWSWERDVHDDWIEKLKGDNEKVWSVIDTAKLTWGYDIAAFLAFMAVRILEMKRVLKDTGSIYLHCDPTASHYLKVLMDAVFGRENFRNEIVWCYTGPANVKSYYPRQHDIILFYQKGEKQFNHEAIRVPHKDGLHNKGGVMHGKDYGEVDTDSLVKKGKLCPDWWADIGSGSHIPREERAGYPTQKPLALYERIIKASSNPGDVVLDPFAGCATTLVAAERLGRQWVGMDIWNKALDVVLGRLEEEGLKGPNGLTSKLKLSQTKFLHGEIFYETEPPERTDEGEEAVEYLAPINQRRDGLGDGMNDQQRRALLLEKQGAQCQGCGRDCSDDPRMLQTDHVKPRSKKGIDHISNRAMLCYPCNQQKSDRMTLNELREWNQEQGYWHWESAAPEWQPVEPPPQSEQGKLKTTRALW